MDVAIVSSKDLVDFGEDDRLLVEALCKLGLSAGPVAWRGSDVDWSRIGVAVVRSTWDYSEDLTSFLQWVDHVSTRSTLVNHRDVIRWNANKRYLRQLEQEGLPVVPTRWFTKGSNVGLTDAMTEAGWREAVYKPVVSGGAANTHRVDLDAPGGHPRDFARLLAERDMMVQPFMERIALDGEVSLTFIAGQYSHAVVKRPGAGDYRVQEELGGSLERTEVPGATVELAKRIVDASGSDLLYARVDLVPGVRDDLRLMELELIEPELFLRFEPASVHAMAAAIAKIAGA
ncbi:MAG: hypothetical protein IH969_08955 [Candidatus Krumholzibacteriota bacterium]|nr:hypothetical protein [Candidatus Krumholzibacteriota bacterium]